MSTTTQSPAETLRDLIRRGDEILSRRNELAPAVENGDADAEAKREYVRLYKESIRLYADQFAFLASLDPASIRFLDQPELPQHQTRRTP